MKEDLKTFAMQNGAHVFGIATADSLNDAPEGFKPADIMATAKSVIVLGKAMPQGALYSENKCVYTVQGEIIVHELDILANKVVFYMEQHGGTAVPIPTDAPYFYWEEDKKHGMGILSHRHAAVKAGLGIIGKSGMLLHPQYGSRITLVSILTDVILENDGVVDNTLCPVNCRKCVDNCPAKAVTGQGTVTQILCRGHVGTTSARGHDLVNCWNCRLVCPVNAKKAL